MSVQERLAGRVGLHSLPQAECFYAKLGMTRLGHDPNYYDLIYWEFSADSEFVSKIREEMT